VGKDEVGLQIIDISNPGAAAVAGSHDVASVGAVYGVTVAGDYVFLPNDAGGSGPLRVIDVSDPTTPAEVASYDTDSYGVVVSGEFVYVASGEEGLKVLRVDFLPTGNLDGGGMSLASAPPAPNLCPTRNR